ncbi:phage baseplate assembly protein V [Chimaeribacter arupi]|uniref:phage baseplate assembly protein V n=1 Tax=Chimaeribacter arupi TaxID=2060066 RepID=UPI000C7AF645|nr:phage baseplate assembly protein V [Chimaeribacter arupi]PLR33179.1 phage baseplate assembly protein V [Chimaeribacter arupi]
MNTHAQLSSLACTLGNLIRIGTVSEVDLTAARCRVTAGQNITIWLPWLTARAGRTRSWWAPSVGEQVLLLAIGGDLNTAFVLPAVFSDANPAPSASADAVHLAFPDGAMIEYEPETGALQVKGITSATVEAKEAVSVTAETITADARNSVTVTAPQIRCVASSRITLDSPEVVCTQKLTTATLAVQQGGTLTGNLTHSGGTLSSNGIALHSHRHGGVYPGGAQTGGPQ